MHNALEAADHDVTVCCSDLALPSTGTATRVGAHARTCAAAISAGITGAEPPPDLVIIGINDGPNIWPQAIHSGTVGGALVAISHLLSAIAVSFDDVYSLAPGPELQDWAAAEWTAKVVASSLAELAGTGLYGVSVNVPSVNPSALRGAKVLDRYRPGPPAEEAELLRRKWVSVLPLQSVLPGVATTSHQAAELICKAFLNRPRDASISR
jgi:broad specificity polyphosphatase/5'/3'-nucleotidase SurE